jgi:2',3'-cyclic-nucleotide 2'-phosphodiesterase (5'-nucleotidase family)
LKYPNRLLVDCGDFFGTAGEQDSLKSAFMAEAMGMLGYDAITPGEREFNFGQQFLLGAFQKTKIDVVSANIVYADDKKPFVKPYVIRKFGAARVAITGLLGKDYKIRATGTDRPLEVLDPTTTIQKLLPEMRKKADVVVLLSHLGLAESQKLTLAVPGIDVMVFGHQAGLFRSVVKTQDVINVRGGDRGQNIPQIHLVVDDGKISSFDGEVVTLDDNVPADDTMNKSVNDFNDAINARFARANEATAHEAARRTTAQTHGDRYLGETTCRRCHEMEYKMYTSQAHAHAFETLVKNQRDATPECLPCHVVGMGQAGGFISRQGTPDLVNVQCENCHGIGTNHPQAGDIVGPEVCMTCHTHEQSPNFQYDEAVEKIVHWE